MKTYWKTMTYPSSHNHGSVENGSFWKVTILLEVSIFWGLATLEVEQLVKVLLDRMISRALTARRIAEMVETKWGRWDVRHFDIWDIFWCWKFETCVLNVPNFRPGSCVFWGSLCSAGPVASTNERRLVFVGCQPEPWNYCQPVLLERMVTVRCDDWIFEDMMQVGKIWQQFSKQCRISSFPSFIPLDVFRCLGPFGSWDYGRWAYPWCQQLGCADGKDTQGRANEPRPWNLTVWDMTCPKDEVLQEIFVFLKYIIGHNVS